MLHGKDLLPRAGEYTLGVVRDGLRAFLERYGRLAPADRPIAPAAISVRPRSLPIVHARPPGFCTGCPERPIFSAIKLVERELGAHHMSADIGCHLFSILPPFHLGNTTMGYGLGTAGASAFSAPVARGAGEALPGKRAISVMGDGGFWHNGLTSGIANAVFNRSDNLTIVVDNNYTSATGGQELLSSRAAHASRSTGHAIERAVRGVGVEWVKTVTHTFDVSAMRDALREALTTKEAGPEGAGRAVGVHAQPAAAREAARQGGGRARRASRARALRRRQRHLHRRPLVHPPLRLPVALDQGQPRPAAHRSGRDRARQLRRLRRLRRGLARGRALPLVLQGEDRQQSDRLGSLRVRAAAIGALQRRDARRRARFASDLTRDGADAAPGAPPRVDSASVEPRGGVADERVLR